MPDGERLRFGLALRLRFAVLIIEHDDLAPIWQGIELVAKQSSSAGLLSALTIHIQGAQGFGGKAYAAAKKTRLPRFSQTRLWYSLAAGGLCFCAAGQRGAEHPSVDLLGGGSGAMSLQGLANVGEFVGGVAVIVSLLYVALQIRQNSKIVRAAAYQSFNEANARVLLAMTEGPSSADTMTKGLPDIRALGPAEGFQFISLVVALLQSFQTAYFQPRDGLLPDDLWRRHRGVARWWLGTRGPVRAEAHRPHLRPGLPGRGHT